MKPARLLCDAKAVFSKQPPEEAGVADGAAVPVVIEVRPDFRSSGCAEFFDPGLEFLGGVVVAIPALASVEAQVNFAAGGDEVVRKAGSAGRAEDDAMILESFKDAGNPPTAVSEL